MKRRKMIRLVVAILVIIVSVVIISKITEGETENKKRLTLLYNELNSSQTYLFEMKGKSETKTTIAKNGDKTMIDTYSEDDHRTTIIKDNTTYYVLHKREEYYVYEQNNVEQLILTDWIKEVIDREFVTGTEKVKGKKYSYEEYPGSTMFLQTTALETNEEDVKTRFYFDKEDNLVYIRTIKGVNQELLEIKIQKEVDNSMFEIPSTYAENSN